MTTADIAKMGLYDALLSVKKDRVLAAVEKARTVMRPTEIIDALAVGMQEVGVRFERGKMFLPHVISAADAMNAAVAVLEKDLPRGGAGKKLPAVVIGTIEGDVHDIGKTIVSTMLQCAGYDVHDLGRDVPSRAFLDTVKQHDARLVGMSALMTTTMRNQMEVIGLLTEEGLRPQVKVMVGGAPATQAWADKIGADGYGENASIAVRKANELLQVGEVAQ
jgi:dimethylamine corrinoid protein